jgi:hypothetical protein
VESLMGEGESRGAAGPVVLELLDVATIGSDIRLIARPVPPPSAGD